MLASGRFFKQLLVASGIHDITYIYHGPLTRYATLCVAHTPGMLGMFSLPPGVSDPDMHHGACMAHLPCCMPGSLTSGFLWCWCLEIFPGFPGACATRNCTYLVRGPCVLPPSVVSSYRFKWCCNNLGSRCYGEMDNVSQTSMKSIGEAIVFCIISFQIITVVYDLITLRTQCIKNMWLGHNNQWSKCFGFIEWIIYQKHIQNKNLSQSYKCKEFASSIL